MFQLLKMFIGRSMKKKLLILKVYDKILGEKHVKTR